MGRNKGHSGKQKQPPLQRLALLLHSKRLARWCAIIACVFVAAAVTTVLWQSATSFSIQHPPAAAISLTPENPPAPPALAVAIPDEPVSASPPKTESAENLPSIAIVLDDLGISVARTRIAIALPSFVSLSFLPDPAESQMLSHEAHLAGHEILVHLPMEPQGKEDAGRMALRTGLLPSELVDRVDWALSRVSDFDGANNHMGSRFTLSRPSLAPVMRELSTRMDLFLDSRTTPKSQASSVARAFGMLSGDRDIFLDDEESAAAVERQLAATEDFARKHGTVIAIGHPHPETLAALENWIEGAEARGFRFLPLRAVLKMREERAAKTSAQN